MVQRGEDFRFALETGEPFRVGRERFGQDLDGDVAIEARVARPIDLAHPAGPEGGEDLVGAEAGAGSKSQIATNYIGRSPVRTGLLTCDAEVDADGRLFQQFWKHLATYSAKHSDKRDTRACRPRRRHASTDSATTVVQSARTKSVQHSSTIPIRRWLRVMLRASPGRPRMLVVLLLAQT